ncbi:L-lactate dehydrogenase, partial [Eubacteriales bacterium OttesenSCG-928-A19]|nr:L-lactate dehydrogenase [Eubacteriales bacterium OttesenSCG-928-A19]
CQHHIGGGIMSKAAIIGAGHVGSHVAASFCFQQVVDEIVLIDIDEKKAWAHATDLSDMGANLPRAARVYAGGYGDIADADLVIISACAKFFDEDRLRELDDTIAVMDDIVEKLAPSGFAGIVLSISNPCDIVAQYIAQRTGLNVIGTGTMLDSARLRCRLADVLGVAPASVQAYCLGEHGDSQVLLLSGAMVGGQPLALFAGPERAEDIEKAARDTVTAGWDIVLGKGCTEFGIGAATAELARAILHDEGKVLPCSTMLRGAYGVEGVYASVPCLIGREGVKGVVEAPLNAEERAAFARSCEVLRAHVR